MQRVIPVRTQFVQSRHKQPIRSDHHLPIAGLHRENEVVIVELARDPCYLAPALHHAKTRKPLGLCSSFRESLTVAAVIRTISPRTSARSIVCWIDAAVSIVSQVVVDWTRIGLSPPMPTFPIFTSRVARR